MEHTGKMVIYFNGEDPTSGYFVSDDQTLTKFERVSVHAIKWDPAVPSSEIENVVRRALGVPVIQAG